MSQKRLKKQLKETEKLLGLLALTFFWFMSVGYCVGFFSFFFDIKLNERVNSFFETIFE